MKANERALARVLEVLCACCVVASLIAAATPQAWWALLFAGCAVCCFEASAELDS